MTYRDNGVGLAGELESGGLGTMIIAGTAEQLHARVHQDTDDGFLFRLVFPIPELMDRR